MGVAVGNQGDLVAVFDLGAAIASDLRSSHFVGTIPLGSAVVGIGFVLYLIYVEVIQIGNICLWCTSVHVITFLLFALLVFAASMGTPATARATR